MCTQSVRPFVQDSSYDEESAGNSQVPNDPISKCAVQMRVKIEQWCSSDKAETYSRQIRHGNLVRGMPMRVAVSSSKEERG
jgi:hypothetical protein